MAKRDFFKRPLGGHQGKHLHKGHGGGKHKKGGRYLFNEGKIYEDDRIVGYIIKGNKTYRNPERKRRKDKKRKNIERRLE
jgi:hypothetical protein